MSSRAEQTGCRLHGFEITANRQGLVDDRAIVEFETGHHEARIDAFERVREPFAGAQLDLDRRRVDTFSFMNRRTRRGLGASAKS